MHYIFTGNHVLNVIEYHLISNTRYYLINTKFFTRNHLSISITQIQMMNTHKHFMKVPIFSIWINEMYVNMMK